LHDAQGGLPDHREKWAFCFRSKKIMSVPFDFQHMLNVYRDNYAAYKVTGNAAYKTAYETSLKGINQHIARINNSVQEDSEHIRNFMDTYEKSNGIITSLDNRIKRIKTEGPKLQDEYSQTKQLNQKEIQAVDNTYAYVKGGIIVGLVIAAGIIGSL
jgi:DNA repair ATPase RecN